MGNNNFQVRLKTLDVLNKYIRELEKEKEYFNTFKFELLNLHQRYEDEDEWNDVKHSNFKSEYIEAIQHASDEVHQKIQDACNALNLLRSTYANAGVV